MTTRSAASGQDREPEIVAADHFDLIGRVALHLEEDGRDRLSVGLGKSILLRQSYFGSNSADVS
jgi:hypothetical protein